MPNEQEPSDHNQDSQGEQMVIKRGRGRPRKNAILTAASPAFLRIRRAIAETEEKLDQLKLPEDSLVEARHITDTSNLEERLDLERRLLGFRALLQDLTAPPPKPGRPPKKLSSP